MAHVILIVAKIAAQGLRFFLLALKHRLTRCQFDRENLGSSMLTCVLEMIFPSGNVCIMPGNKQVITPVHLQKTCSCASIKVSLWMVDLFFFFSFSHCDGAWSQINANHLTALGQKLGL